MKPYKISTHSAHSDNCYFHFFCRLSEWVEIFWGFTDFFFKQMLKVSAFYLEKKSLFHKNNIFLSHCQYRNKKNFVYWLKVLVKSSQLCLQDCLFGVLCRPCKIYCKLVNTRLPWGNLPPANFLKSILCGTFKKRQVLTVQVHLNYFTLQHPEHESAIYTVFP